MTSDVIAVLLSIGVVINKPHLVFLIEQALSQVSPRREKWQMTGQTPRGFYSRIIQRKKELVMHFMAWRVLHYLCALHNLDI